MKRLWHIIVKNVLEQNVTYVNPFLVDFLPVFYGILEARQINLRCMELIIWDEELEERHIFERADARDVLYQLGPKLNALTIYTERPEYYVSFVRQMDEEWGLQVVVLPKKGKKNGSILQTGCDRGLVLDFEWNSTEKVMPIDKQCYYVPIHKKPWKIAENLDILVPFGYNTVIVKGKHTNDKIFVRDRFDEGFYRDE